METEVWVGDVLRFSHYRAERPVACALHRNALQRTATHCNAEAFPSEPVTIHVHVQVLARGSTRNRTLSMSPLESEGA